MGTSITLRTYANRIRKKAEVFNKPLPLAPHLVRFLPATMRVRILDLGSGPLVTIGNLARRKRITVTACDSLAREYAAICSKRGIRPLIPIEYQDMENLTYPDGLFDIVHCSNALDHTGHPDLALKEMLRVCKPGGWVYLRHLVNEGSRKNYTGLHQWNLELYNQDCRIWNKSASFLLTSILPGAATVVRREGRMREKIVSTFRKA